MKAAQVGQAKVIRMCGKGASSWVMSGMTPT